MSDTSNEPIKCTWSRRPHVSLLERDDKDGHFAHVEHVEPTSWWAWKTTSPGSVAFVGGREGGSEGEASAVRAIREAGVSIEVTNPGVHERLDNAERKLADVLQQLAKLASEVATGEEDLSHLEGLPCCKDCPIGGRDGSGPECPRARLCDRDEARWTEILANEGKEGDT